MNHQDKKRNVRSEKEDKKDKKGNRRQWKEKIRAGVARI